MFWLKLLSKFVKVLREGASPGAIAAGFTVGFIIGLTPFLTLQNFLLLAAAALFRWNFAALGLSMFFFSFFAYLFDPLFHRLGWFLLVDVRFLQGFYTWLYNLPVAPFTRFYNTIVAGSTAVALALAPAVYIASKRGVVLYREHWAEKFEQSRWVRALKGTKLVQWYFKIRDLDF